MANIGLVALTSVNEMPAFISQEVVDSIPPNVGISSPQVSTTPNVIRELQNPGYQRPSYLGFSLPQKEQPYDMPTTMMVSLHHTMSIYSGSTMVKSLLFNPYLASVSIMGNFGQLVQPPKGIGYFPLQDALSLTNNSLQVIR